MESFLLPLGLLGIAAFIGGIVGFFSLFSSGDKDSRIKNLERETERLALELTRLSTRLDMVKRAREGETASPVVNMPASVKKDERNISVEPTLQSAEAEEPLAPQPEPTVTATRPLTPTPAKPQQAKPAIKLAEPNFIEKGIATAKNWLLGGNTLVRSGIVILFIGISFLIKYAAEHTHVLSSCVWPGSH